jgi:hypothetical protein
MKKLLILLIVAGLITSNSYAQCNGAMSATLSPLPASGQYLPGQVVTACFTMNGYTQTGSNWIEGFDLTLGPGWASVTPLTPPANCGGAGSGGQWIWMNSSTSTTFPITTVGPGYFFDLNSNGNAGDDFGDSGSCVWTFCVTLTVANTCTPLNLLLQFSPGSDGVWGSYTSSACDLIFPFTAFNGTINPTLPSIGPISHN